VTWQSGRQEVIAALRAGELQQVTGGQAAGDGWIAQARRKYETARLISDADPETAYVTASFLPGRSACTARPPGDPEGWASRCRTGSPRSIRSVLRDILDAETAAGRTRVPLLPR
jgi:hypothetical protein